jgi:hypothetical protein
MTFLRDWLAKVALFAAFGSVAATAQQRVTLSEANASIVPPEGWRTEVSAQRFVAIGPHGEAFTLRARTTARSQVDEAWLRDILPSLQRDAATHGYRVVDVVQTRATAPIFPSIRYAYTHVGEDGRKTFVDGYAAMAGSLYTLEYTSQSREFLPEFSSFVRSLQSVDKFAQQRVARLNRAAVAPAQPPGQSDVLSRPVAPNGAPPPGRK